MPDALIREAEDCDAGAIVDLDFEVEGITSADVDGILEVETIDVVADKGYFKTEGIAACEEAGLTSWG